MLFNSYIFIFLFLPLVLLGYYGLNYLKLNKLSLCYLVGMSLWFYGYNNIYYLFILAFSVIINFVLSRGLHRIEAKAPRLVILWSGLILNLGILFYFKYYDFFIENMNQALKTDFTLIHVVLPLGISFYTFQQLSYVIDCYRNECERYSLLEYASYVTFFPQLIAGPIVYHSELIPQLRDEKNRKLNYENLSKGIYAFALGLAKKVLIADNLSGIVAIGFSTSYNDRLTTTSAVIAMVCYSLQIYFDFSGYCDMAYGIGYMFNIKLPVNFNSPYKADSIGDFWDRWHMTLTRFFTKYVYIPLGGNRKGTVRTYINILIVFLVSGFWHGANWGFVLWGLINGIGVAVDRVVGKLWQKIVKPIRMICTFAFSTFAWSLFRSEYIVEARALWRSLLHGGFGAIDTKFIDCFNNLFEVKLLNRVGFSALDNVLPGLLLVIILVILVIVCMTLKNTQEKVENMQYTRVKIAGIVIMLLWSITSLSGVSEFLYFNF